VRGLFPWRTHGICSPAIGRAFGRVLLFGPRPSQSEAPPYGHFGRPEFSWERIDKVEALKAAAK
jgi:hypothetical protein